MAENGNAIQDCSGNKNQDLKQNVVVTMSPLP